MKQPGRRLGLAVLVVFALLVPIDRAIATSTSSFVRTPIGSLRVLNYYPADAGWSKMWTTYSHSRTSTDFGAVRSLGANTVRVIVQPAAVGFPDPTVDGLAHVRDMIDTARSAGLGVQLTLFDWWHDYGDISGSRHWLDRLLAGLSGDATVSLAELQNEIPTDDAAAMNWARALLPDLGRLLPGVPRALSASSASGINGVFRLATIPADLLDVVSVHYYGEPAAAAGLLATAKVAAARPVIVGEAGRSTVDGAGADEAQARFFRQMAVITQALALPPAAPWTLTDFSNSGVPAGSRRAERYYGLRRTDGSWKPAAAVVRSAFSGHVGADIDGGFEREVNGGSVLGSWSAFDATDGLAQVRRDLVRHGHAAACFSATKARPGLRPSITQSFPVLTPHQVTTAQAWVTRRAGKGTERIALAYFDSSGRYLSQVESRSATGQIGWELLSVRAVAPQDATLVQLHLKAGAESGRACYDDVVVR